MTKRALPSPAVRCRPNDPRRARLDYLDLSRDRGGHAYLVRPVKASGMVWFPEVIDENTTSVISTKTTSSVAPDCSPEAARLTCLGSSDQ
jgi:hypothetical protein